MNQNKDNEEVSEQPIMVPPIEDDVALPKNAREAFPDMSPNDELTMRANTVKLISDLAGKNIEPTQDQAKEAKKVAEQMMTDPKLKPDFGTYPNETIAYLAGMVSQTSHMVAKDLADIKLSVVNGLLQEASLGKTSRDRISAWAKLGEIDGIDAFKRKTEITHITKSGEELEKELMATIEQLKGSIVEGEHEIIEDD